MLEYGLNYLKKALKIGDFPSKSKVYGVLRWAKTTHSKVRPA